MKRRLMILLVAASCGSDSDSPDTQPDAGMPVAPDAAPGSDAGAEEMPPDAAPPDAPPPELDGGPTGPTIESVATSDGYTQIRQGESVQLVITGQDLAGVTNVVVGELGIADAVATSGEIRVWVLVPHGAAPGPRNVMVNGLDGADTERNAIEVTPYVVTPALVPPGGRGTFQSPLRLCDEQIETARAGDTILLLAGQHICQERVDLHEGGQFVQGQGRTTTIIGQRDRYFPGFEIRPAAFSPTTTTFRDFSMQTVPPVGRAAMDLIGGGAMIVERVDSNGPAIKIGGGCRICEKSVTVRESSFLGTGIDAAGLSRVEVFDSTFTQAAADVGIHANGGRVSITRTTFDRCTVGVRLTKGETEAAQVEIRNSVFTDTGISMRAGRLAIMDSSMTDSRSSDQFGQSIGIDGEGELEAIRVTIARTGGTGIEAFVRAVQAGSVRVSLTEVLIEGGHSGVRLHGPAEGGGLFMTSSIVRNQTVAAVSYGFANARYDFRGGNQLSVVSGVALEDARIEPLVAEPIPAAGILLNGKAPPPGVVQGPAERPPDYRIVDPRSAIEF